MLGFLFQCLQSVTLLLSYIVNGNTFPKALSAAEEWQCKPKEAIRLTVNQINIIKAQLAIGKTHCYVNQIKNSDKRFIVAVPTNILKKEVYNRLKALNFLVYPDI